MWPYNQTFAGAAGTRVQHRKRLLKTGIRVRAFYTSGAEAPDLFWDLGDTTEVVPFARARVKLQGGQGNNGKQNPD
jgi:hypothetical protein